MINLLPEEYKREVAHEYAWRFAESFGIGFLVLFMVALFALAPSYIFVYSKGEFVKQEYEALGVRKSALEADQVVASTVADVEKKLALVKPEPVPAPGYSAVVEAVLLKMVSGVSVDSIIYEGADGAGGFSGKTTLTGVADDRKALLRFRASLEGEGKFLRIESPIENLIKDRNLRYTLFVYVR